MQSSVALNIEGDVNQKKEDTTGVQGERAINSNDTQKKNGGGWVHAINRKRSAEQ
jgi:hypothetical protein